MAELDLLRIKVAEEQGIVQQGYEAGELSWYEHRELMDKIKMNSDVAQAQSENIKSQQIINMSAMVANAAMGYLRATGEENSKVGQFILAASKALAVAQAIINTNVAVTAAMAIPGFAGMSMIPWIKTTGYASAALIAATALTGGGGGSGGGVPSMPTSSSPTANTTTPAPVLANTQANQSSGVSTTINIVGKDKTFTGDQLEEIFSEISDALDRGDKILFSSDSRQALELA